VTEIVKAYKSGVNRIQASTESPSEVPIGRNLLKKIHFLNDHTPNASCCPNHLQRVQTCIPARAVVYPV